MRSQLGDSGGTSLSASLPSLQRRTAQAGSLLLAWVLVLGLSGCGSSTGASGTAAGSLSITASTTQLRAGATLHLSASGGAGPSAAAATWSVVGGAPNGTVDTTGLYTAPALPPAAPVTVTLTSAGESASISLTVDNPLPSLISVAPSAVAAPVTALTVAGSGFVPASAIQINGQVLPTTFVDGSHLSATLTEPAGTSTSLTVQVSSPNPGASVSTGVVLPVNVPAAPVLSFSPSTLAGGSITLTATAPGIVNGSRLWVNGTALQTTASAANTITATGFLPPWLTGSVPVSVTTADGGTVLAQTALPIAPTAVPFDTAARFATQAGFGPRPDIVLHIQQVGLSAFLDEQLQQPVGTYSPLISPAHAFFLNVTSSSSMLRLRTAWALQTFIPSSLFFSANLTEAPWEETLERDAFTNYRQILTDAAGDPNVAGRLNLPGNMASTDPNVHPNQNFARECMQLFSLGTNMLNSDGSMQTDANGNPLPAYDQNTVIDMSRVFTGWNYAAPVNPAYTVSGIDFTQPLVATESQHDTGSKTLFGSVQLPAGQSAEADRSAAIDALLQHPNTAPFVSRLLIQRFVKSQPSPAYVARVAAVFRNNGSGVSGNMPSVLRAILLDPEARLGDTTPQPDDGFLQDSIYAQAFLMGALQITAVDDQAGYIPQDLGEEIFNTASVFSYFSPSYVIPGTTINSPEFQLFTNFTAIQRSQFLWAVTSLQEPGFANGLTGWLYNNFTTLPAMLDALDHLLYHGEMPASEKAAILSYCGTLSDPHQQLQSAVFLALNSDSYTVVH